MMEVEGGDVRTPRRHRRRSSMLRESVTEDLVQLPLLRERPEADPVQLFRMKLQLCCVRFNFEDSASNPVSRRGGPERAKEGRKREKEKESEGKRGMKRVSETDL